VQENEPCPPKVGGTCCVVPKCDEKGRDPAVYESDEFPCVYRELRTVKDDRGRYIDPFRMMRTMPDGRRLIYDTTHPDLMYGSQWSSELADAPSCYSFPVTLDFDAEIPWKKDLQWQVSWLEYTIHRQLGQVVHTCHLCTSVSIIWYCRPDGK